MPFDRHAGSLSRDEAQEALARLFGDDAVRGLKSEQWKLRKEAMEAILAVIQGYNAQQADSHASEVIQGISYLPGWGEKNFQVVDPQPCQTGVPGVHSSGVVRPCWVCCIGGSAVRCACMLGMWWICILQPLPLG